MTVAPPPAWVPGHFGEFIQGRLGPDGPVSLVTLPCLGLGVAGWHYPGHGLRVHGAGQRLATPARARHLLAVLGLRLSGGVVLRATMPAGGGAGASTASLVVLARLAGWRGDPLVLARACVAAEGASDPLMFAAPECLLWASRRAEVLDRLPALPRMEILGGFYGPLQRTDPAEADFPDISDLVEGWRSVAVSGDLKGLADLASASAGRTLRWRGHHDDPTPQIARDLGALGFCIAHTGAARGLIFAPGTVPAGAGATLRAAGFTCLVQFYTGGER